MQSDLLRKDVFLVNFVFCTKNTLVALILVGLLDEGTWLPKDELSTVTHLTTATAMAKQS
jgi:hypothetical protein